MNDRNKELIRVWRRLKKNKLAVFGLAILITLILAAILSSVFVDYDTQVVKIDMKNRLLPPSSENIMGTDSYGRDIMTRVIYGTRYSLSLGFIVVIFALLFGGSIGAIAGYFGKRVDNILMRIMDIFLAVPATIMAIAIVSTMGTGFVNLCIALIVSNIPTFARLLRATVLTIKDSEFVEAAHALGTSTSRIIIRHILPNSMGPIIVQSTFTVASAILGAASLSFLGIGIEPPNPEWGAMLTEGREFIRDAPHLVIFPGIAIALTVLSLNLLGDGLRDALDPRLKK